MSVRLVDQPEAFQALLAEVAGADLIALDTEAASFHRYHDRIYLVQLSTRSLTAVIDPLGVGDLAPIGAILADPGIEKIFHDADYDLRLFDKQYGYRAQRLFDSRIAAQFLGEPGIGLGALLEKYFKVTADKRFQRADWSARPWRCSARCMSGGRPPPPSSIAPPSGSSVMRCSSNWRSARCGASRRLAG